MKKFLGVLIATTMLMSTNAFANETIQLEVGQTIAVDGGEISLIENEYVESKNIDSRDLSTAGFSEIGTLQRLANSEDEYFSTLKGKDGWMQTNWFWRSYNNPEVTIINDADYSVRILYYIGDNTVATASFQVPARTSHTYISTGSSQNQWFEALINGESGMVRYIPTF